MTAEGFELPLAQGQRALLRFDDPFLCPDGALHSIAWGRVWYFEAKALFGFDPKVGANFLVQVGEGDGALLVAGCRVHYAVLCADPVHVRTSCYIPPSEK